MLEGWNPRTLADSGVATDATSDAMGNRAAPIAAGGLLAMLTNSLMPFAFERGKDLAGVATVVGFCLALLNTKC